MYDKGCLNRGEIDKLIIGYARVSYSEQNLSRQVYELIEFGCDKIFTEKQTGRSFKERSVYNEMRSKLRIGDVLVVHDLSRFGRNKREIKEQWESLMKDGIDIVILKRPILDTRKNKELEGVGQLISNIVLTLLSWMVEEESERNRSSQREGIEIAKKQGKYKGRKKKYHKNATGKDKLIYDSIIDGLSNGVSVMDIHRKTGVSRSTIYLIKNDLSTSK